MFKRFSKMSINSKIILNGLKKDLPQLRIIEPFNPTEKIECEDKDDFIQIINNDIEKYNSMTTQKLNKIFIIPGYKVTKIKGEICLRAIKENVNNENNELNELHSEIFQLKKDIRDIKDAFNQLSEQMDVIKKYIQ